MNKPATTGLCYTCIQQLYSVNLHDIGASALKVAPIKLGFTEDTNAAEGDDEQDEQLANTGDTKGLSHTLRYTRVISWMCELTLRHKQLLPPRRSLRSSPARRCACTHVQDEAANTGF